MKPPLHRITFTITKEDHDYISADKIARRQTWEEYMKDMILAKRFLDSIITSDNEKH